MPLTDTYDPDFERLWRVYPKWPAGRSKKKPSADAFARAKKQLGFTPDDIAAIERDIEKRLNDCETWQSGNKFGPVMFATYCNQRLWNESYQQAKRHWTQTRREEAPEQPTHQGERMDPEKLRQMLKEKLGGLIH